MYKQFVSTRESVEWLNFWIDYGNKIRNDRILLIGDSVSREYRAPLAVLTQRPVDIFATSAYIHSYMFWKMLELYFSFKEYKPVKVQIQIGVHGVEGVGKAHIKSNLSEWKSEYERLVDTVLQYVPDLTLALTTPVVKNDDLSVLDEPINNEIIKRNEVVKKIAQEYNLKLNDLYSLMEHQPHRDWVHFPKEGSEMIAKQTASVMNII